MESVIEASYPIVFRKEDATKLGRYLQSRQSVALIGMRRVGISNFLRFFLYHKDIVRKYISEDEEHMFIPVDLNDLVEREIFPFWVLTLKRILDTVEVSTTIPIITKKEIEDLFLQSIQSKDLFLLIDSVRKSLLKITTSGIYPTIFFIRFDRIKDAITPEFFANLQGLKDAMHQKLAYVFTGFRSLETLSPTVFTKSSLSVFAKDTYLRPARREDTMIILQTYKKRFGLNLPKGTEQALFELVDGHIQYLQLSLILLREEQMSPKSKQKLFSELTSDERISLQSEELWESLEEIEQIVLLKIDKGKKVTPSEKEKARYLWDTGFLMSEKSKESIFSPLFEYFLKQKEKKVKSDTSAIELSKKEHLLFSLLLSRVNEICEREAIIEGVWPEVEALGVSDWAIDRLAARVRSKLKIQESPYEIQTIKTRGYKLIAS